MHIICSYLWNQEAMDAETIHFMLIILSLIKIIENATGAAHAAPVAESNMFLTPHNHYESINDYLLISSLLELLIIIYTPRFFIHVTLAIAALVTTNVPSTAK